MARITELTITYKRTNQVRQYEPEDIFLALKFSLETLDQGTKAVKDVINHGLSILTDRVDAWSHEGAQEVSRHITVTDQDGKVLPVPDAFKGEKNGEKEKPEEGGDGAKGDSPSSSQKPGFASVEDKKVQEETAAMVIKYGDDAPVVDLDEKGLFYRCPAEDKANPGNLCMELMEDNRELIKSGRYKANSPHFKCPSCQKAIWPAKPKKKKR